MSPPLAGTNEPNRPCAGDVVIMPDGHRLRHYVVAQLPGAPQMSWGSRDAAIAAANPFARRHSVDIWMQDGKGVTRVARHRRATTADPSHHSAASMR